MSFFTQKDEYDNDNYDERLTKLKKYSTRNKLILGAIAGLLFFTATDLISSLEKIILISFVFVLVFLVATALLGFDNAISEIENSFRKNRYIGDKKVNDKIWPTLDEKIYKIAAILTFIVAFALIFCMVKYYCRNSPEKKVNSSETRVRYTTKTLTFLVGPFVQGFDTLYTDSTKYKLNQLKASLTNPARNFTEINIYGGVDKRPLKGLAKNNFGDNLTLAQARGEWIKRKIIDFDCLSDSCQLFIEVMGAKTYSKKNTDGEYAMNRYVIIDCKYQDSILVHL